MSLLADAVVRLAAVVAAGPEFRAVLTARGHRVHVDAARAAVINERVRIVAGLFAALTIAWIVVDAAAFERGLWIPLALGRVAAGASFAAVALWRPDRWDLKAALRRTGALFAVPVVFFAYSAVLLARFEATGASTPVAVAYQGLPFVVVAGLAIFPLTAKENAALGGLLLVLLGAVIAASGGMVHSDPGAGLIRLVVPHGGWTLGAVWLLILIAIMAGTAGVLQLQLLFVLIERSARDALTGLLTRRFGEETLELQFHAAVRSDAPLCLVFIDLDQFKSINDRFGHDRGDEVLRSAARRIAGSLRRQDAAIRWGGEEFLVLMPNTGGDDARIAVDRLAHSGLGLRPDGTLQTASVGLAERVRDSAADWRSLVEIGDRRMYAAKTAGRNRIVGLDDIPRGFIPSGQADDTPGATRDEEQRLNLRPQSL